MSTTAVEIPKSGPGIWLRWMGASLSAWVIFGAVSGCALLALVVALGATSDPSAPPDAGFDWVFYGTLLSVSLARVVAGFAGGAMQWLLLRRRIGLSGWWVLATGAGWLFALIAMVAPTVAIVLRLEEFASTSTPEQARITFRLTFIVAVSLAGLVLGTSQWLVLRRQVQRAGWWIPATIVAWALGGLLFLTTVLLWLRLLLLVVPPAITGVVFAWLWRRPRAEAGAERPPELASPVTL